VFHWGGIYAVEWVLLFIGVFTYSGFSFYILGVFTQWPIPTMGFPFLNILGVLMVPFTSVCDLMAFNMFVVHGI